MPNNAPDVIFFVGVGFFDQKEVIKQGVRYKIQSA
jgi:hypothetical protein